MFARTRSFFHRITRAAAAGWSGEERRIWERHIPEGEANVRLEVDDGSVIARIQDVSRGGIRLVVDRPMESGAMVRIDLPSNNGVSNTTVLACVVHVQARDNGQYSIGCNFSTELSDNDLESLGARKVRSAVRDQRAWARVPIAGIAIYSAVRNATGSHSAIIHNISPTGVALQINEELTPGTLLNLELRSAAGETVLTIVGCVVYRTTLSEGQWLAGCNFVRELYDEDLHALIAPVPAV